jgi:outer membrane protease
MYLPLYSNILKYNNIIEMSYIGFTGTYTIQDELINNIEISSNILNTTIINSSNDLQNKINNSSK